MPRVLVVIDETTDESSLRTTLDPGELHRHGVVEADALAICHVLAEGNDGFAEALAAQRRTTHLLRHALGPRAESVAVFVAASRDGERAADCARAWGATMVIDTTRAGTIARA